MHKNQTSKIATISEKKMSQIIFSAFFLIISLLSFSAYKLKEEIDVTPVGTSVYVYQNLIQLAIPTTNLDCGYFQNLLSMFDIAYQEINGLSSASCLKSALDDKVAKINAIIKNGQCDSTSTGGSVGGPVSQSEQEHWEGQLQGILLMSSQRGDTHTQHRLNPIYRTFGSYGRVESCNPNGNRFFWTDTTQNALFDVRQCDYLQQDVPQNFFGLLWIIDYTHRTFWQTSGLERNGDGSGEVTGVSSMVYIRSSAYDRSTAWGLDSDGKLYWANTSSTQWTAVSTSSPLTVVDINPNDGSVYGVSKDNRLFVSSGIGKAFSEITGLSVIYVRISGNGKIYAIDSAKGQLYLKTSIKANWQLLDGQSGFTYVDANNKDLIYAIKSDHSVFYKVGISGSWTKTTKVFRTLRVLDDNMVYGLGLGMDAATAGNYYYASGSINSGLFDSIRYGNTTWSNEAWPSCSFCAVQNAYVNLCGPSNYQAGFGTATAADS